MIVNIINHTIDKSGVSHDCNAWDICTWLSGLSVLTGDGNHVHVDLTGGGDTTELHMDLPWVESLRVVHVGSLTLFTLPSSAEVPFGVPDVCLQHLFHWLECNDRVFVFFKFIFELFE